MIWDYSVTASISDITILFKYIFEVSADIIQTGIKHIQHGIIVEILCGYAGTLEIVCQCLQRDWFDMNIHTREVRVLGGLYRSWHEGIHRGCAKRFCSTCGQKIEIDKSGHTSSRPRKFCSDACKQKFWKAHSKVVVWASYEHKICRLRKATELSSATTSTNILLQYRWSKGLTWKQEKPYCL